MHPGTVIELGEEDNEVPLSFTKCIELAHVVGVSVALISVVGSVGLRQRAITNLQTAMGAYISRKIVMSI